MDTLECIRTIHSVRRFKSAPVPKQILRNIIDAARWTSSYRNNQPWEVVIVSGTKKEQLSNLLLLLMENNASINPDVPQNAVWPDAVRTRMREYSDRLSETTGLDLSDPKKAKTANYRFYDAPHLILLFHDMALPHWALLDLGRFAQSVLLAAHAEGLGTIPVAILSHYSKEVREILDVPDSRRLVMGIATGFPVLDDPVNSHRSNRLPTQDILRWVE